MSMNLIIISISFIIDSPFNRLKLGSETFMSWSKNTIKTKIEDEVIIESNCGNE